MDLAPAGDSRSEQLNIRLSEAYADLLTTVAFLKGEKKASLARAALEEYLDRMAEDARVQRALIMREEMKALDAGTLTDFPVDGESGA